MGTEVLPAQVQKNMTMTVHQNIHGNVYKLVVGHTLALTTVAQAPLRFRTPTSVLRSPQKSMISLHTSNAALLLLTVRRPEEHLQPLVNHDATR